MADYTAIVEAGSSLVEMLRDNLTPEPVSKREMISLCSPYESENNQVTVYLYHVEEDRQGMAGKFMNQSANVQRMAPTTLNLSFLITAHSMAPVQLREADQYRLMGAVIQTLKDMPVLNRSYLQGSLAETGADLRITVEKTGFDQMIKIWNNNTKPYKLSIVCRMEGVAIDSSRTRKISRVTDVDISVRQVDEK